ncbi:Uncharacterized protein SCG7086_AE_00110 [Chlamydiales bacterium SCGC AG-110-P3]|nr:Uncharacterized protein SCG7086_AE_00110 [Chlamydiales bacterium SCGC AG-110-P3]
MLQFFRRYQKILFFFTTGVIAISFSFFGSYSAMNETTIEDPVVFYTVDGSGVKRSEMEQMILFLATDVYDKQSVGWGWGPNFLNDGVVRYDIVASGLAPVIAEKYFPAMKEELNSRLQKEKRFRPYIHPQARFINAEMTWSHFAPELKASYDALRASANAVNKETFQHRIDCYLAESQFPGYALAQVMRYQEGQYDWVQADPTLTQQDLALFHYHSAEDWFGRAFVRLCSQFVINAAKVAEERGYVVTKEEALADLMRHANDSYQYEQSSPEVAYSGSNDYMAEQLRRMNIGRTRAVKLWRQVLLFRRLMNDARDSVFVDPLVYEQMLAFSGAAVTVDEYCLPEEFRFDNARSMHRFEVYLDAIAERDPKDPLALPHRFKSSSEVMRSNPALVQRRYALAVSSVDKEHLEARVGVRDTWNWEVMDLNWAKLIAEFPELRAASTGDESQRYNILANLDPNTRNRIDAFARAAIVKEHPEWISETLGAAKIQVGEYSLAYGGKNFPFEGVTDRHELIAFLDGANIVDPAHIEHVDADASLAAYTGDETHYYRILVLDRSSAGDEIMNFSEALVNGAADELLDNLLKKAYGAIREKDPESYRQADGRWKTLNDVKAKVANEYFAPLHQQVYSDYLVHGGKKAPTEPTGDFSAVHRVDAGMRLLRDQVAASPEAAIDLLREGIPTDVTYGKLSLRIDPTDQWRLVKEERVVERNQYDGDLSNSSVGLGYLLTLKEGEWSPVLRSDDGHASFALVRTFGISNSDVLKKKVEEAGMLLGAEAQQILCRELLEGFRVADAIDLTVEDDEAPAEADEDAV